jgi:hypothetical protein
MIRGALTAASPARLSTFAALHARDYCLYWFGLVFYVLGHRAEYVTFVWITWEMTHDPLSLGYLGLAQGVPLVVFQLFGGVLADRTNRLRLLIGTRSTPSAEAIRRGRRTCVTATAVLRSRERTPRPCPATSSRRS